MKAVPKFAFAAAAALLGKTVAEMWSNRDNSLAAETTNPEPPWQALIQQSTTATIILRPDGTVSFASHPIEAMLGHPTDQLVGHTLEWVCHSLDFASATELLGDLQSSSETSTEFELRAFDSSASTHILSVAATKMASIDGSDGNVLNITDITGSRLVEAQFEYASHNDQLTLLPNRAAFHNEVDLVLRRASVTDASVAVAIINIDDFRVINEGYGAETADQVLIALALRMRQTIGRHDMLSRLGGDEFGILLSGVAGEPEARQSIQQLLDVMTRPIWVEGLDITIQASAGLICSDDSDASAQRLVRKASTALDSAKALDRGHIATFTEDMGEKVTERAELRDMLRVAIEKEELRLAYQPILDIDTGEIVSLEALTRWTTPERGPISPDVFIPIAEASNLINDLGSWALRTACHQIKVWEKAGFDGFTVAVNFSGKQLLDPDITAKVDEILKSWKVAPDRITIEITESVLIDDTETISARFRELKKLGVGLAIDDFGTGFSSLSYLRRYEFDILKIDRSFVVPLAEKNGKRDQDIVATMISLAASLGATTVAEGIEHEAEYQALKGLGCNRAQGFLFWKPIDATAVLDVLQRQEPMAA